MIPLGEGTATVVQRVIKGKKGILTISAELETKKVTVTLEDTTAGYNRSSYVTEVILDLGTFYQLHQFITFLGEEYSIAHMEELL